MPDTKPTNWEDIALGKFFIINGQHSITASIKMKLSRLLDKIEKLFLRWYCFIEREKLTLENFKILQSMQPLQFI